MSASVLEKGLWTAILVRACYRVPQVRAYLAQHLRSLPYRVADGWGEAVH